jgi:hypothetical protein
VALDETIDAIRSREGALTLEDTFVAMTATGGRR